MSYRLSADVIGAQELAEAFRRAPEITIKELSKAIGKTAFHIEAKAKQLAPIEHGNLRGSITTKGPTVTGMNVEARVGTNVEYARYQEEGTGIYGPNKTPIRPKTVRRLAWKKGGQWFFAKEVRGVKPKRFFKQAREDAVPVFTENIGSRQH